MTSSRQVPAGHAGLAVVDAAALVAVLLGVPGCGAARDATVHGDATVYGKVLNDGPHRVTVIAARQRLDHKFQLFHTLTSKAGTYSLTVPPGAYILTSPPCGRVLVRLRADSRIKRNFNCIVL
jgi:hypothetical protein